jgi:hypothetical protein
MTMRSDAFRSTSWYRRLPSRNTWVLPQESHRSTVGAWRRFADPDVWLYRDGRLGQVCPTVEMHPEWWYSDQFADCSGEQGYVGQDPQDRPAL